MATKPVLKSGVLGLATDLNRKANPFVASGDFFKSQGWYLLENNSIAKRRGFKKVNETQLFDSSGAASFTGLFEYTPSVGPTKRIATTTKGLYVFGSPSALSWNEVNLSNVGGPRTGTIDDLYDYTILFDQVYIGGGASTDPNIRFVANGAPPIAYNMGIAKPSVAPVASTPTSGGSIAAGVYSYKVTFSNADGEESNTSPASNDVTVIGGSGNYTITVTNIPISSDPQVTKRYLYRTTTSGGVWLLLAVSDDNTSTSFIDTYSDGVLTVAAEDFAYGVPPHFSMIDTYQGIAFMGGDPKNLSRVWFSGNGKPTYVNSNDYRDLDPNDGNILTGIKRYKTTVCAFKSNSIWNASGTTRDTLSFEKRISSVGSVNNAGIIECPVLEVLMFMNPIGRIYVYDGVTAKPTALNLEPLLTNLNPKKLKKVTASYASELNQVRWLVPDGGSDYCNLLIWYDYIQDKWGTCELPNILGNYCTTMHDDFGKVKFYMGGVFNTATNTGGGYVWEGDNGGSDDGSPISVEVTDKGHPSASEDSNVENVKMFDHIFVWFKPVPGVSLEVSCCVDDPDSLPIHLATINCDNSSGQEHLHLNQLARRLYINITESSMIQGTVLRGWRVWYKDVGRHHAP